MLYDHELRESTSVVSLGRAGTTRDRVPYPAGGVHKITLSETERAAVRRSLDGLTPGGFLRRAVRRAAGVEGGRFHQGPPVKRLRARVAFMLTRPERAAVDAARSGRDLTAWVRDAVRVAAGMRNNPFSECAEAVIRMGFRRVELAVLLRALPGRTSETIYQHAVRMGLDTHRSEERMTLHQAAAFAGYADRAMERLLREEGVELATLVGSERESRQRPRVVRRGDVERAVKARASKETVAEAARRLGRNGTRLAEALRRAGHVRPEGVRYWRLPSEVFDEVSKGMRTPAKPGGCR